jgi:hypothetical protein
VQIGKLFNITTLIYKKKIQTTLKLMASNRESNTASFYMLLLITKKGINVQEVEYRLIWNKILFYDVD